MPYKITYHTDKKYLHAIVTGDVDKDLVPVFFAELAAAVKQHNCMRVLTDAQNAKVVISFADLSRLVNHLDKNQLAREVRRAIVIAQDHVSFQFWENVCFKRGYDQVKIFYQVAAAKQWLQESTA